VVGDPHVRAAIAQERRERRAIAVEPVEDDPPASDLLLGVGIHRGAVWMSS
jgi:class 3 adenylate cyclase